MSPIWTETSLGRTVLPLVVVHWCTGISCCRTTGHDLQACQYLETPPVFGCISLKKGSGRRHRSWYQTCKKSWFQPAPKPQPKVRKRHQPILVPKWEELDASQWKYHHGIIERVLQALPFEWLYEPIELANVHSECGKEEFCLGIVKAQDRNAFPKTLSKVPRPHMLRCISQSQKPLVNVSGGWSHIQ